MSAFLKYIHDFTPHLSIEHWVVIFAISFAAAFFILKSNKVTRDGSIALVCSILIGLFILDSLTVNRLITGAKPQYSGLDLSAELQRLIAPADTTRISMLFNVLAFIPFGFFLSWGILGIRHLNRKRCINRVVLIALGLSFCIEFLQFILKVGFFELTDMILNTFGAVMGAVIVSGLYSLLSYFRRSSVIMNK